MKLKILIAEDKPEELESSIKVCKRLSNEVGFTLETGSIIKATTLDETLSHLQKKPFDFDIVILDIGFGETDLEVDQLSNYLKADTLAESKVIIHSGNPEFKTNPDKILSAICNGAKTIAIKGEPEDGIFSFEYQFKRILQDIKFETVWANIGRFTPQWKRDLFRSDVLWKDLKIGKKVEKIFLLIDISNSTQFVISQRNASKEDKHILELFKSFANLSTDIIELNKFQGIVERYSGDEILAYFKIQNAEEDCLKVIECANIIKNSFTQKVNELYDEYGFVDVKSGQNIVMPELRILIGWGEVLWVLLGADSRPQLSIMTDKVAKFYRCFTDRDKNYQRTVQPNKIFITDEVNRLIKTNTQFKFEFSKELDLRDFGNQKIFKLNN